ncbi:MAG: ABC transporter permease [Armatimonadota bacterium]|nr:ABC transporter permease [Armatimonadota bacterium]MDR7612125.1 ABC transporter permease [Armatimonadota bacterium]
MVARLIVRRLLVSLPLMVGLTLVVFLVSHLLPGDPVAAHLGQRSMEHPEIVATFRAQWGLDRPLHAQYLTFLSRLLRGDLGVSIKTKEPVLNDLARHFPASVELAVAAILFSAVVGIPLGVLAAVGRGRWVDHVARAVSLVGVSAPVFWLALVGLYVLYLRLGWLPGPGRLDVGMPEPPHVTGLLTVDALLARDWPAFRSAVGHLILPALVLGSATTGLITRMTRSSMLDVLDSDYVRTARAKGLGERPVLFRHALRNALIPTVTVLGLSLADIMSGAVLTETIFAWPGVGRYAFGAAISLDFPAIMGVTLLVAAVFTLANLTVDVAYLVLDPRQRVWG